MSFSTARAVFRAIAICAPFVATPAAIAADKIATATITARADITPIAVPKPKPAVRPAAHTRFVIGLERKVDFEIFALANPNRLVVELPDVRTQLPAQSTDNPAGLVNSFRSGLAAPGKMRVVIDLAGPVIVDKARIEKSADGEFRLALDLRPAGGGGKSGGAKVQTAGLGPAAVQPPLPKRAANPKVRSAKAFRPIIVIDPGHGGDDSGAMKFGTVEKNVVLAFGHVLRELLEKTGRYKVLMTRDKDIFIPLDERLNFAERNGANLFIAVHADYASTKARGATIFTLRDAVATNLLRSTRGDRLLTKAELTALRDGSPDSKSPDTNTVEGILSDLAERDVSLTKERTSVFARSIISNMSESTTMRDEPDQQAAFRVLKTARFPSVLIELAYVTNREDAANLNSDRWREKVADSIVTAVESYFSDQVAHLPM